MYRTVVSVSISAMLAASTATAGSECDFGSLNSEAPPETAQFSFLVGHHEITLHAWQGDGWSPPRPVNARWNGWYGLDGRAIYDEWFDPAASGGQAVRGVNVRVFDPNENLWKMMWVSTPAHVVKDLRAQRKDGVLTMWQVYPERPGWKAEFEIIDDRRWARVSYVRDEETGEWARQYRLAATELDCEESS